jgi:hypothetical protein
MPKISEDFLDLLNFELIPVEIRHENLFYP